MKSHTKNDITILEIEDDNLDATNASAFKEDLKPFAQRTSKIILDLTQVRFIDSTGLGAILSALRQLNAKNGDLKLCGMSRSVRVLFELVRMHRIVEILNTRDEAIKSFSQPK